MEVDHLLDSGSNLTPIPRSILERLAGQSFVNEVPVNGFKIGLARSDMTVVCRVKAKMDVDIDTTADRVLFREIDTYVVDAVVLVGVDFLQELKSSPQDLLE